MESQEQQTKQISFRFLTEFRGWLDINRDKDILDISTSGGWDDLKIVVTFQTRKNLAEA